ncbi:MAG TPA: hypothetical protein VFC03_03620 [Acidimicrobiales bacterium]|nr:hypothetical protein [Acidimicrobiales bacterium]
MVDVAYGAGSNGSGPEWTMRSLQAVDDPKRHLDRLVPLLHELVAWDLVHRAEDGSFVLREDVQERLAALTADRPVRSAQVYVGRKCELCDRVTLTRMVDGLRICSSCSRAALTDDAVVPPPQVVKGRSRFHRHRHAS